MSWFPQIGTGSLSQFPLRRSRKWRSISNQMEGGERIALPDFTAGELEWQLSLQELSDDEAGVLGDFFVAAQGKSGSFLFIDPMANLLGWSEDFSQPDWQRGLLSAAAGATDPLGTTRATVLANSSAGAQSIQQTIAVPGDYVACFSAWVSSGVTGAITIERDGNALTCAVGPVWRRVHVNGRGASGAGQSSFAIVLAAGQTVNVWGLQVEAQPYPSQYRKTGAALGIYEETYFGNDELRLKNTGLGLSSCEIVLCSRV
jgi:hypothetical protein